MKNSILLLGKLLRYASVDAHEETAEELLKAFGGKIENVMDASYNDLKKFKRMNESAAVLLKLIPDCVKLYGINSWEKNPVLKTTADAGYFLADRICSPAFEEVYIMCLDKRGKVIKLEKLGEGDVVKIEMNIRKAVEMALNCDAEQVVLAHNHPSGNLNCSKQDVWVTESLKKALAHVGIKLKDHFIISNYEYWSMKDNGFLSE